MKSTGFTRNFLDFSVKLSRWIRLKYSRLKQSTIWAIFNSDEPRQGRAISQAEFPAPIARNMSPGAVPQTIIVLGCTVSNFSKMGCVLKIRFLGCLELLNIDGGSSSIRENLTRFPYEKYWSCLLHEKKNQVRTDIFTRKHFMLMKRILASGWKDMTIWVLNLKYSKVQPRSIWAKFISAKPRHSGFTVYTTTNWWIRARSSELSGLVHFVSLENIWQYGF
jgi:hypothetical protein